MLSILTKTIGEIEKDINCGIKKLYSSNEHLTSVDIHGFIKEYFKTEGIYNGSNYYKGDSCITLSTQKDDICIQVNANIRAGIKVKNYSVYSIEIQFNTKEYKLDNSENKDKFAVIHTGREYVDEFEIPKAMFKTPIVDLVMQLKEKDTELNLAYLNIENRAKTHSLIGLAITNNKIFDKLTRLLPEDMKQEVKENKFSLTSYDIIEFMVNNIIDVK